MKNQKGRYWSFVAYPESLPNDWIDLLIQTGLAAAISPLHDKDCNPDGEVKKAHYHVIICWEGPTTYSNVCSLVCDVLKQPRPQKIDSVRGMFRYFIHKDNPEKFQYDQKDIKLINHFNPEDYDQPTERELDIIAKETLNIIKQNNIFEYSDLMDFLEDSELSQHFRFARRNTIFLDSYIKSKRHKPKIDKSSDTI